MSDSPISSAMSREEAVTRLTKLLKCFSAYTGAVAGVHGETYTGLASALRVFLAEEARAPTASEVDEVIEELESAAADEHYFRVAGEQERYKRAKIEVATARAKLRGWLVSAPLTEETGT